MDVGDGEKMPGEKFHRVNRRIDWKTGMK